MKTNLSLLLVLSAFAVFAQDAPPPSDAAAANTNATNTLTLPSAVPRRTRVAADTTAPLPTAVPAPAPTAAGTPVVPPAPASLPPSAPPPAPKPVEEETIPPGGISLTGADVKQLLTLYAKMVGRSVLQSPTVGVGQGTIFFRNETALTQTEARQAYEALLALNNIAMVPVGEKFVKALTITEAGGGGGRIGTNAASELPELGQYVSHVVQLKYVKPGEVVPAIQPFARNVGGILAIESSGILVLRDYAENVKRMLEMIERVDVTVQSEFVSEVIPIKFAKAEDIAQALNSLSTGGGATTVGTRATSPGGTPPTGAGSRPGGLGAYSPGSTVPGAVNTPGVGGTPSSTSSFSDRLNNIIRRAASTTGSGEFQIIGPNKIVADVRSNSLMIFASKPDMETIKKIINQLDVVLAQVVIETIIMDVALDDTFNFGVSGIQTRRQFGNTFAGAGGLNANKFFDFSNASATNSAGDLLGSGLRYFGKVNDDIYVTVEAMASDGRVNVIQKPRIQTSHATPAAIFVGSTVPYVSSTYYGGGYAGGPSSSYQQLSVGIGLNVTPFINADGLVVMKIDETIDEISSYTKIDNNSVPNTSHRTLSAEVAVRDRETILLGGFIRNSDGKTKSGVPFLKDIPLLGNLFSSIDTTKSRKELIVLMRPTVLRTPELAAAQVIEEKMRMPGVMAAERAYDEDEAKVREKTEADYLKSQTKAHEKVRVDPKNFETVQPFTEEEKALYGRPSTPPTAPQP